MRECVRLETNKQMHFRQLIPSGLAALNGQGKMRSKVYLDPTLFVKLSPSLSKKGQISIGAYLLAYLLSCLRPLSPSYSFFCE